MQVIYFSQDYTPHDHRFLEALSGTEHEVHFLRLEDRGAGAEQRPLPGGIRAVEWWGGRHRLRWVDLAKAKGKVRKVIHRLKPDLVHAGPVQRPALLSAMAGFHPLVTMSWGSDLLRGARSGPGRWAARYTLARSEALICDCETVRQAAIDLGMPSDRIVVFPWGVDLDHFTPGSGNALRKELGWEDAFVILSTRAWEPLLGVELLVDGFAKASAERPELRLLLLSNGSLRGRINARLREAKLGDRVHFAGQVSYDHLPEFYRASDLYCSASRSDGSSISLLESMACRLPGLVSDIPGNREWVEPEVNGWWFRDGDAGALASGLARAVDRRHSLFELGRAARQVAEARADWAQNSSQLLVAYETALGRRQS